MTALPAWRIPASKLAPLFHKAAFAGALVALALAVTYTSSAAAFSDFDRRTIAALGGTVTTALLLLALVARAIANTLLTLIALAGVTTAYLIHTEIWSSEPAVVIGLCATSGFALFVAFRVIDDRRWGRWLSAAPLLGLAAVLLGSEQRDESASISGDVSNIRDVSLSRTPNLYLISFDAVAPRALLKKYFDVDGTGFHTLVDAKFRRFPNFFANAVATRRALYTILALDPQVYHSQKDVVNDPETFSGQNPSPLLGILRSNGYETTTIYDSTYFGGRKGPWVDNYVYFWDRTLCSLLDEAIRPWAFWGYCRWFRYVGLPYPAMVDRVTSVDADGEPQFTMAHFRVPGHTETSYRHSDTAAFERYKTLYLRHIETAAEYLDRIVRHVEQDPDAILLVYSDHGMYLSQGLKFNEDPEFSIQDRYGVLGGVFPPDACAPWFDAAAAPGWMTHLDAVHAVLSCLSDGRGALVEPPTWMIDPSGEPATSEPFYSRSTLFAFFEDFLYE